MFGRLQPTFLKHFYFLVVALLSSSRVFLLSNHFSCLLRFVFPSLFFFAVWFVRSTDRFHPVSDQSFPFFLTFPLSMLCFESRPLSQGGRVLFSARGSGVSGQTQLPFPRALFSSWFRSDILSDRSETTSTRARFSQTSLASPPFRF